MRKLVEDLQAGGVDATLDQWDLPPGADVVAFMEAGSEGTIVTSHVACSTDTVKFIPLVRDNPTEPLAPDFLGPRLWLDFRDEAHYAERLEELVRELHEVPRLRKPPPGCP